MFIQILYFFMYSFMGWCYESTVVSIQQKKWVNRGFIHGPFLPIYGVGGMLCVLANFSSGGSWIKTFIYATIVCTVMEFCTGLAMEAIFKVRYWDYRNYPLNIKGYICPAVSALWGVIALIVSNYIQPFIVNNIASIPENIVEISVYVLSIYFAGDFVVSWAEGIDLRDMLIEMSENSKTMDELIVRINELENKSEELKDNVTERFGEFKSDLHESKLKLLGIGYENKEKTSKILESAKNKLTTYFPEPSKYEYTSRVAEKLGEMQAKMKIRNPKRNHRALSIIRRNPHVVSGKYMKELETFREIVKKRKGIK